MTLPPSPAAPQDPDDPTDEQPTMAAWAVFKRHPLLPNISDRYADLLAWLDEPKRRGMILQLSVNYYEGWHPSCAEVADLVAVELGIISIEESNERQRLRSAGSGQVPDITPLIQERHRRYYSQQ